MAHLPINKSKLSKSGQTQNPLSFSTQTIQQPLPSSSQRAILPAVDEKAHFSTNEENQINILLVGETGVGKSTFINAFANYLTFGSLEEAEREGPICYIPTEFIITDDDDEEKVAKLGEDINECNVKGQSSTQSCRCYEFSINQFNIHLIDTPGIGDTRGLDQDQTNMDNVLYFIGQYKEIHAICILLKPNSARMTASFEFCIKQLLCHLEKSASQNIVFLYTNARGTFYKPGDTGPALRAVLEQVNSQLSPSTQIKYNKDNRFCLDNEAFRFLIAVKNEITFTNDVKKDFAASWEKSTNESLRLIKYVVSLKPHKVQDTISINEARRLIVNLSKPLADIAENITTNLIFLKEHEEEIQKHSNDIEGLRKLMYIPIITLELDHFDKPRTVCTGEDCRKACRIGDLTKYHYPQKCHDPCRLTKVPKEIVGDPELAYCAAMYNNLSSIWFKKHELNDKSKGQLHYCMHCGCSYMLHMHIYYDTKEVLKQELDKNVADRINNKQQAKIEAEKKIRELSKKREDLSIIQKFITDTTAMFAHYLCHNATIPYNDAFENYVKMLIKNQEILADHDVRGLKNKEKLARLRQWLKEYKEQKDILDREMSKNKSGASTVTTDMIFKKIQELETIDFSGTNIADVLKQRWKLVTMSQMQESKIIHKAKINTSIKKKFINWGKEKLQIVKFTR